MLGCYSSYLFAEFLIFKFDHLMDFFGILLYAFHVLGCVLLQFKFLSYIQKGSNTPTLDGLLVYHQTDKTSGKKRK